MATTIQLSDPISTLVSKTNTLIGEVGDISGLATPVTTDLVAAINEINTRVSATDGAADINAYFAGDKFRPGGIDADSATIDSATFLKINVQTEALITGSSTRIVGGKASLDSAQITKLGIGTAGNLAHAKPLQILDASGTVLKQGYLLSTSATDNVL
jgi:hypothetical protein